MTHPFSPITFETGLDQFCTIDTFEQAAQYMLESWHRPPGPSYLRARKMCFASLIGRSRPDVARNAFLDALKEAHLFVRQ